jgi:hypothetical protein
MFQAGFLPARRLFKGIVYARRCIAARIRLAVDAAATEN